MKARELLTRIISTGYSKSTMQKIFNMAHNEQEAERIAALIDTCKTEEELLQKLEDIPST